MPRSTRTPRARKACCSRAPRWFDGGTRLSNRTDEDMNASLRAEAASAERVSAYQSMSAPLTPQPGGSAVNSRAGSPRRGASPKPPAFQSSQSVMGGIETAHSMLTPDSPRASLHRSASTGDPGRFAALKDSMAGLDIRQTVGGVLGGLGGAGSGSSSRAFIPQHGRRRSDGERRAGDERYALGGNMALALSTPFASKRGPGSDPPGCTREAREQMAFELLRVQQGRYQRARRMRLNMRCA